MLTSANFIQHSGGMLESLLTVAYEQYVIDDDINAAEMRIAKGIEVNDQTLSVDVINEVARDDSHFMMHPQTLALQRSEYTYLHTADRKSRDQWTLGGGLDMRERARRRARVL